MSSRRFGLFNIMRNEINNILRVRSGDMIAMAGIQCDWEKLEHFRCLLFVSHVSWTRKRLMVPVGLLPRRWNPYGSNKDELRVLALRNVRSTPLSSYTSWWQYLPLNRRVLAGGVMGGTLNLLRKLKQGYCLCRSLCADWVAWEDAMARDEQWNVQSSQKKFVKVTPRWIVIWAGRWDEWCLCTVDVWLVPSFYINPDSPQVSFPLL